MSSPQSNYLPIAYSYFLLKARFLCVYGMGRFRDESTEDSEHTEKGLHVGNGLRARVY